MIKKHNISAAAAVFLVFFSAPFVSCEPAGNEAELYQRGKDVIAVTENIDEVKYPNLARLKQLFVMEKNIDFSAVNLEKNNMIAVLAHTLKKEDLDRVQAFIGQIESSTGIRDRVRKETGLYKFMFEHTSEINYPQVYYLIGYNELFLEIDPEKLKEEIGSFSY